VFEGIFSSITDVAKFIFLTYRFAFLWKFKLTKDEFTETCKDSERETSGVVAQFTQDLTGAVIKDTTLRVVQFEPFDEHRLEGFFFGFLEEELELHEDQLGVETREGFDFQPETNVVVKLHLLL
jgi:hypothetical protein